jgi:hypothetical protein
VEVTVTSLPDGRTSLPFEYIGRVFATYPMYHDCYGTIDVDAGKYECVGNGDCCFTDGPSSRWELSGGEIRFSGTTYPAWDADFTEDITGGTIYLACSINSSYPFPSTFTPTGGTVEFCGSSNVDIYMNSSAFFHDLQINKSSAKVTARSDVSVAHTLNIGTSSNSTAEYDCGSGTTTVNSYTNVYGTLAMNSSSAVLDHNGSTTDYSFVWHSGSSTNITAGNLYCGTAMLVNGGSNINCTGGTWTFDGSPSYYWFKVHEPTNFSLCNLTSNRNGLNLSRNSGYPEPTFSITNTFTINSGCSATLYSGSGSVTLDAHHVLNNGTLMANGRPIYCSGNWTNNSTFSHGNNTVTFDGNSTGYLLGTLNFFHFTVNKGSSAHIDCQNVLDVDGDITISSGYLDANGYMIEVAGDWTNSGNFIPANNTVVFNGSSTINAGGTGTGRSFYSVELNGTGAILSSTDIAIDGDFTLQAGLWNANGRSMYVRGDWINNAGAGNFDPAGGTVYFDGIDAQEIAGLYETVFYDIDVK